MINNPENCPRFPTCSINKCPLDHVMELRTELPEEKGCPFTIRKRNENQKGIRTQAPDSILKVIPRSNLNVLNKSSLKRWHKLRKKNAKR